MLAFSGALTLSVVPCWCFLEIVQTTRVPPRSLLWCPKLSSTGPRPISPCAQLETPAGKNKEAAVGSRSKGQSTGCTRSHREDLLSLLPIYRRSSRGLDRFSDIPKVTQLGSGGAPYTQINCWTLSPKPHFPTIAYP